MCVIPQLHEIAHAPRERRKPRAAFLGCGSSSTALFMNDPCHSHLLDAHEKIADMLDQDRLPRAIVVVSPQWQTQEVTVTSAAKPRIQADCSQLDTEYGGMPCPPGSPEVAAQISKLLRDGGVKCTTDQQAPLVDVVSTMLMYPGAEIPIVSMSVLASLSTEGHVSIGRLLQPLCKEGVLFLGLGLSSSIALSPNIDMLHTLGDPLIVSAVKSFKKALDLTVTGHRGDEIGKHLVDWECLPCARINHPSDDHMMPLLVVAAAAGDAKATQVDASFVGLPISNYVFA